MLVNYKTLLAVGRPTSPRGPFFTQKKGDTINFIIMMAGEEEFSLYQF